MMVDDKEAARRACIIVSHSMLMQGEKDALIKFICEQQTRLAAEKARVAEMHKINEATVKRVVAEIDALNERAEKAEANFEDAKEKIAMIGAEIVRLSEGKEQTEARCAALSRRLSFSLKLLNDFEESEFTDQVPLTQLKSYYLNPVEIGKETGTAILDRMKRMEDALREIAESKDASAIWIQDIAKAALEEKP